MSINSLHIFLPSVSSMILLCEEMLQLRKGLNPALCAGYLRDKPEEAHDILVIPDEGLLCQLVELALDSFDGLGVALQVCSEQLSEAELDRLDQVSLEVYRDIPELDRWSSWLHAKWDPEKDPARYHARVRAKLLLTSFRTYMRKARDEGR